MADFNGNSPPNAFENSFNDACFTIKDNLCKLQDEFMRDTFLIYERKFHILEEKKKRQLQVCEMMTYVKNFLSVISTDVDLTTTITKKLTDDAQDALNRLSAEDDKYLELENTIKNYVRMLSDDD